MQTWDQKFNRSLNDVRRGLKNLRKMGLKLEAQDTETMLGTVVKHGYVIDRTPSGNVVLQKHLFTIEENGMIR
uniref:Uncharacterized protein n=1 Tax=viral metagenome TaxID=1070528 RepID=A0A6M3JXE2_9ZZZZ